MTRCFRQPAAPNAVRIKNVVLATICGLTPLPFSHAAAAGPGDDAFYHQLLKTQTPAGYRPTRTFTIITDAEHGNQMVAEDDPDLRFNLLWMQQFQPGYKTRNGGAAFGEIARSYLRSAYKSYRDRHAQTLSAFPDENGTMKAHAISNDLDYHLNWNGGDFKLGIKYSF
jgi:hypothetical protein